MNWYDVRFTEDMSSIEGYPVESEKAKKRMLTLRAYLMAEANSRHKGCEVYPLLRKKRMHQLRPCERPPMRETTIFGVFVSGVLVEYLYCDHAEVRYWIEDRGGSLEACRPRHIDKQTNKAA